MTYCVGLFIVALFIFIGRKIGQIPDISMPLGNLLFFKLHYLGYGLVLTFFFPTSFMVMFDRIIGAMLIFCLAWIGVYYGCSLEIRSHQKYSLKTLIFHSTEPVLLFIFAVLCGIFYVYLNFGEIRYLHVIFTFALFSSLTLFKRPVISHGKEDYTFHPILIDLVPARNIYAIIALSIICSLLFGYGRAIGESPLYSGVFNLPFTGTVPFFFFHIIVGLGAGIVFNMLIGGAKTADSMAISLIGVTALTGGITYTFSLSPLFVGMISGAFLINSTLKKLQTIEAISVSHNHIEKIFMFLLGMLLTPLIQSGILNIIFIVTSAFVIFILRSSVKYILASLWVTRFQDYPKGTSLLWMGLTGQGIVAAGAAVECFHYIPQRYSVFFLLIVLLILNQFTTALYVMKNR